MALTHREWTAAAKAVKGADRGRQVRRALRPRGVTSLLRTGLPLARAIELADRQGRLVWQGPQAFCIVQVPPLVGGAPRAAAPQVRPPRGSPDGPTRRLDAVDRYWDVLCFVVPPFLSMVVAVLVAGVSVLPWLSGSRRVLLLLALGLVAAALAWVALVMTVMVLRPLAAFVGLRPRRRGRDWIRCSPWSGASRSCTRRTPTEWRSCWNRPGVAADPDGDP